MTGDVRNTRMDTKPTPPAPHRLMADGLCLHPWQRDDVAALHQAVLESAASVGLWLPWCHSNYGADDAVAWIEYCQSAWHAREQFAFGIVKAGSGMLLGGVGLSQCNWIQRSANLGFWVRSSCQQQGIAAKAALRVARFGFEKCDLNRIELLVLPDNIASRRTAEKIGAKFEGIVPRRLQERDVAVYALGPDDLR